MGPTSQYLVRALGEAGFSEQDRADWYVTNLVKHENPFKDSDRLPADWVKDGLYLLHQELRLVRPEYLLALGVLGGVDHYLGDLVHLFDSLEELDESHARGFAESLVYDVEIKFHFLRFFRLRVGS